MGTMLQILGNHNLEFDSGKQAIQIFQDLLKIKVDDGTYQSKEVKTKLDDVHQIKYFTSYEYLEDNFDRWKEVKILTNYKFCSEIFLFKKAIRYDNGCKYTYWKNCIFNEEISDDQIPQHKFCKIHWEKVKEFSIDLTRKLGGHMLIYFDDNRFQNEEDLYQQGESLEIVIDEMSKIWKPTIFNKIQNRKKEFSVRNGWFIKKDL